MPCQCGTTASAASGAETTYSGCDCGTTASAEGCGCATAPSPAEHAASLERVVMELDKRVRKLEGSR